MEYSVTITETLKMTVTVKSDNPFEAEQIVSDKWKNGEYILDSENFCDVDFTAKENESCSTENNMQR